MFDDRDILIEIWKERRAAGDAYIELMWKGAQFFFLIIRIDFCQLCSYRFNLANP